MSPKLQGTVVRQITSHDKFMRSFETQLNKGRGGLFAKPLDVLLVPGLPVHAPLLHAKVARVVARADGPPADADAAHCADHKEERRAARG